MALDLAMAISASDRVWPLQTGDVSPDGIDLTLVDRPPSELFRQVAEHEQFDLSEMSLSTYVLWTAMGECPYVGLPVFPSRLFRHSAIYVNSDAGIDDPADLRGTDVGVVPEYQVTAATTVRGVLQHQYGVHPESMTWYAAREEKLPVELTDGLEKHVVAPDQDLERMLERGEIDALVSTLLPDALGDGVERLFPDYKAHEKEYYRETGVFPIMHTLVMHERVYEEHPWVANQIYEAMVAAKDLAIERLYDTDALHATVPWLIDHVEEARSVLGEDYWPYGFRPNREAIATLARYSHEQGLSPRLVDPEALFVEELLHTPTETATRASREEGR